MGAYGANSDSAYGTNDQGGNVIEWNDAVFGSSRGLRGGSWDINVVTLASSSRGNDPPFARSPLIGFRVASSELAAVPEPTTLLSTLALVSSGLLLRRRGKGSL